jgi:ABC-type transport system involved in cytochrome c biogenesis permease subunit
MWLEGISRFCFGASYAVALLLEIVRLFQPRPALRYASLAMGGAGLFAHTVFLALHRLDLVSQVGSLLFLAWILAVFYLYGTVHYRRFAWGVFVLPVVLGLVVISAAFPAPDPSSALTAWLPDWERFWGMLHGTLLLLASVGVCIGFVASVMYLIQAHRLRTKAAPSPGLQLMSLERLEQMNRRAINVSFPLMTAGVLVGIAQMLHRADQFHGLLDPKIIAAVVLWVVYGLLVYLRYGAQLRGRQLALLTIVAFILLLVTLSATHPLATGSAERGTRNEETSSLSSVPDSAFRAPSSEGDAVP